MSRHHRRCGRECDRRWRRRCDAGTRRSPARRTRRRTAARRGGARATPPHRRERDRREIRRNARTGCIRRHEPALRAGGRGGGLRAAEGRITRRGPTLDAALQHFAAIVSGTAALTCCPCPAAARPAGGGRSGGDRRDDRAGFALVATATGLDAKVVAADVVITGEGRLDGQTAYGKTVSGVAGLARKHGKRIGVIAGSVDAGV